MLFHGRVFTRFCGISMCLVGIVIRVSSYVIVIFHFFLYDFCLTMESIILFECESEL